MPTVDNGLLAEDFTSVTFKLLEGVIWSDGEPFTAADVVFTLDWILDKIDGERRRARHSSTRRVASDLRDIEATDDYTVTITFSQPNPTWSDGYTGAGASVVYPKHILEGGGQEANDAFKSNPIGTGPYKVENRSRSTTRSPTRSTRTTASRTSRSSRRSS